MKIKEKVCEIKNNVKGFFKDNRTEIVIITTAVLGTVAAAVAYNKGYRTGLEDSSNTDEKDTPSISDIRMKVIDMETGKKAIIRCSEFVDKSLEQLSDSQIRDILGFTEN